MDIINDIDFMRMFFPPHRAIILWLHLLYHVSGGSRSAPTAFYVMAAGFVKNIAVNKGCYVLMN